MKFPSAPWRSFLKIKKADKFDFGRRWSSDNSTYILVQKWYSTKRWLSIDDSFARIARGNRRLNPANSPFWIGIIPYNFALRGKISDARNRLSEAIVELGSNYARRRQRRSQSHQYPIIQSDRDNLSKFRTDFADKRTRVRLRQSIELLLEILIVAIFGPVYWIG